MIEFIESLTSNTELITLLLAMVPIIELRGAIPVGISLGLPYGSVFLLSVFGNLLPIPFIIIFIRRIFVWIRRRIPKLNGFVDRMERKAEKKRGFMQKWSFLGLMLLVAVPLPGTGAWTGALVAALLDMRLKSAMLAIALGVLIAGCLVMGVTYGFTGLFV